ncbi:MAG: response regulator transcription factor [Chloroflexi bacterium]|nr:response regulator transcription factor [Chloroflexota bacterium]
MKVLLVDDQILFRKGVRALLEAEEDIEIVSEAGNGNEAANKVKAYRPDVVLMDIHMPECDGIEATRLIKAEHPDVKIVILTVSDEDDDLFEAIKAGAEGYLLKNLRPDELIQMLRSVVANEAPLSPAIASKLLGEFRRHPRDEEKQPHGPELTSREREVLQLVAEGMSNAEIGLKLCVVEGTVKNHLHNILEKLHLQNRVQAAAYAMRAGLVPLPPRE